MSLRLDWNIYQNHNKKKQMQYFFFFLFTIKWKSKRSLNPTSMLIFTKKAKKTNFFNENRFNLISWNGMKYRIYLYNIQAI